MSTIESLDLATLTNNPQSIAEALEDVLETSSGNIGTLKTSAQTDHDAIETLLTSAQSDAAAIEAVYNDTSGTQHHYTSLNTGFTAWNKQSGTSSEHGVRVQNIGKIWVVHIMAYYTMSSTGSSSDTIVNIATEFDEPESTVIIGNSFYGSTTQNDFLCACRIETNGDIDLYMHNGSGTDIHIAGSFMGLEI